MHPVSRKLHDCGRVDRVKLDVTLSEVHVILLEILVPALGTSVHVL